MELIYLLLIPIVTLICSFLIYDIYIYYKIKRKNIIQPQECIGYRTSLDPPQQKVMV